MRFYINECCMNRIYEGVYILLEGVACFAKSVHYMPKMTSRFSDAFEINLHYNFSAFLKYYFSFLNPQLHNDVDQKA